MKAYTDIEQSKKLAEILPLKGADMHYNNVSIKGINYVDEHRAELMEYNRAIKVLSKYTINPLFEIIPCWSLSALISLLPSEFTTENKFGTFKYTIRIRKYKITEDEDVYQIAYGNYKYYKDESSSWKDMINTGEKENLIDAAFDMICWLHKQKLI